MKTSVLVLSVILGISSSTIARSEPLHFPKPRADFQAHIAEVEDYLLATKMQSRKVSDVKYNLPFEEKANSDVPYRGQFFLIHGLNDSPYVFSDVSKKLTDRGFDVRAILLPGHGNTPESQLYITHHRWMNAARQQLALWRKPETPMYLAGFSMGAVIATLLALENNDIAGLLLFSPAYKSRMNHLLRWSSLYSHYKPWIFGGMIIEDNPIKYNSIPVNGGAQYYKLTKKLRKSWSKNQLDMPILAVASANDSVVDVEYFKWIFEKRFTSKKKRLVIYSNAADLSNSDSIIYRESAYPEFRIINQSHQGLIIAPQNPLFGVDGSVLVCNGNEWAIFSSCLYSRKGHWYGAQHTLSPDDIPVARTTFNPDFTYLFAEFDRVFD